MSGTAPSIGLLILRLPAGGMLLSAHGWGKLMRFSERSAQFSDPLGVGPAASLALAVFAEVFCAAAVVLGAATRFAAVPIVIMLLVAAAIVHADDPWRNKEFALIYAVPFLALVFTGGGRYSFDRWWAVRRAKR
jgi:putative oxidoreductase